MATLKSLHDVMLHELFDLYDAEKQLVKALPKMAKAASHPELSKGFKEHLDQTKEHVHRLERAFKSLGVKAKRQTCDGMKGLIKEGEKILKMKGKGVDVAARDAALISAAQRVEHYEIAAYGCVVSFAKEMGHSEVANLMEETLREEKQTDEKLTKLAEHEVNEDANDMHEMETEREEEKTGILSGLLQ